MPDTVVHNSFPRPITKRAFIISVNPHAFILDMGYDLLEIDLNNRIESGLRSTALGIGREKGAAGTKAAGTRIGTMLTNWDLASSSFEALQAPVLVRKEDRGSSAD